MNRRGDSRPVSLIISFFVVVVLVVFVISWLNINFGSGSALAAQRSEASVLFNELFDVLWREMNSPPLSDDVVYSDPRTDKPLPFIPAQSDEPFCVVYSESKPSGFLSWLNGDGSSDDVVVCLGGCSELPDKSGITVVDCNGGTIQYATGSRFAGVFSGITFFTKEVRFSDKLLRVSFGVSAR